MTDKFLMENILYTSKVINDLYLHGVIESSNTEVMNLFNTLLKESLKMHNELYKAMENAKIYTTTNAEITKVNKVKQQIISSLKKSNTAKGE